MHYKDPKCRIQTGFGRHCRCLKALFNQSGEVIHLFKTIMGALHFSPETYIQARMPQE
jgi:hypothetical protein